MEERKLTGLELANEAPLRLDIALDIFLAAAEHGYNEAREIPPEAYLSAADAWIAAHNATAGGE